MAARNARERIKELESIGPPLSAIEKATIFDMYSGIGRARRQHAITEAACFLDVQTSEKTRDTQRRGGAPERISVDHAKSVNLLVSKWKSATKAKKNNFRKVAEWWLKSGMPTYDGACFDFLTERIAPPFEESIDEISDRIKSAWRKLKRHRNS